MSYLVLARKYRPLDFKEISGQEHVTRTLVNAIKRDKIPHAILLTGPRGVGKTSIARIFAKALNCEKGKPAEPCLECSNCREITGGRSLAVQEIDGASHNSVDNIRELIETFRSLPAPGYRYKIYIIDEVHMLSSAAFNALLKSLEEPPPNTVFILATTEVHKVPETVISRCQRHDLRALMLSEVSDQLEKIARLEKIKIEPEALRMIARMSDGSMRDAQSLLDRLQSFCEGDITAKDAALTLGMVEKRILSEISSAIFKRDPALVLDLISAAFSTGIDVALFLKEFVLHWRELLIAKFGSEKALSQLGISVDERVDLLRQVKSIDSSDLQDLLIIAREGADIALRSSHPLFALEGLLVRMASREPTRNLAKIIDEISGGGSGGGFKGGGGRGAGPIKDASRPGGDAARPAGAISAAVSRPAAKPNTPASDFSWQTFVNYCIENTSRLLLEHLKRLEVVEFMGGRLAVRGPEFTIRSIEKGDYREKLLAALQNFSKIDKWELELTAADGSDGFASVAQQEKQQKIETIADKKRNLTEHPQIQKLKAVFPGSAIEEIKIKD